MPERGSSKGCKTGSETWLFALWCHPQVHVVPEPTIGVLIPILEKRTRVLSAFDSPWMDIFKSVPPDTPSLRVEAIIAHSTQDTGSFGQSPDTIVFQTGGES